MYMFEMPIDMSRCQSYEIKLVSDCPFTYLVVVGWHKWENILLLKGSSLKRCVLSLPKWGAIYPKPGGTTNQASFVILAAP